MYLIFQDPPPPPEIKKVQLNYPIGCTPKRKTGALRFVPATKRETGHVTSIITESQCMKNVTSSVRMKYKQM